MTSPVSARQHTALAEEPLSVDAAYAFATDATAGAVVVFTGTTRDHSEGRAVAALSYEAYVEQAQRQLVELADEVAARWPRICAVWLEHRVGTLAIGEPAVVVAVSAPHRDEAFLAARHGIDTLKATVAIWKQEHWADGGSHFPGSP